MKTTSIQHKGSFFHWLLSVGALIALLLSLLTPGGSVLAAIPLHDSYIIVFKDTVNPAVEAPAWRKPTVYRPAISTSMR